MDLTISSEKIGNPLLIELLRKLTDSFGRMDREFYVIGATARDIIVQQLLDTASTRRTRDLDIAIAIPDWDAFEQIKEMLAYRWTNLGDTRPHTENLVKLISRAKKKH
jgi:predicted nucleotidyltransferase